MNRIVNLFTNKRHRLLSVYFTAGYPGIDDTLTIIRELTKSGVDMIEIGIPFSDPVADGPVIQQSNQRALANGMNLNLLFSQLSNVRDITNIPLIIMGYFNPIFKLGVEHFLQKCTEAGIDGVIIPDLPPEYYQAMYKSLSDQRGISNICLVTPRTTDDRIRYLDSISSGFLYMVTASSTTGTSRNFDAGQVDHFKGIKKLKLSSPLMAGFGIHDRHSFDLVCRYMNGAIIGSAFINAIKGSGSLGDNIHEFINSIKD